jgi:ABC-2 type transport system permease protein
MTGVVFSHTLKRNWPTTLYWGIGIGLIAYLQAALLPNVDALQQMADLMATLPPVLIQAFGGEDVAAIATPEGYISFRYFGFVLILFAVYAVTCGLNVTASEEDQGIMDVVLSLPLPRWRLVVEKLLTYTVLIIGAVSLSFVGLWSGIESTPALEIATTKLFQGSVNILPSTLLVLAATTLIAAVTPRRGTATAAVTIFLVTSYFIDFLGRAVSDTFINRLSVFSFFTYYDGGHVMQNGLVWSNIILLLAVAALLVSAAVWAFQQRDIGV